MAKVVRVHVGDALEEVGQRFADAWRRAERGDLTPETAEAHVGFESFETMGARAVAQAARTAAARP